MALIISNSVFNFRKLKYLKVLELEECLSDDDYLNEKKDNKLHEIKHHRLLPIQTLSITFSNISVALTFLARYSNQTDLIVLNLFIYDQESLSKTDSEYLNEILKILTLLKNLKSFSTNIFQNFHDINVFKRAKFIFPRSLNELNLVSEPTCSIRDGNKIQFKPFNVKKSLRNFNFTDAMKLFEECYSSREFLSLKLMFQFNCYELCATFKLFIKYLMTGRFCIERLHVILKCLNSGCLANGGNDCLFKTIVTNFYISSGDFLNFVSFDCNFTKISSSIKSINVSIL